MPAFIFALWSQLEKNRISLRLHLIFFPIFTSFVMVLSFVPGIESYLQVDGLY